MPDDSISLIRSFGKAQIVVILLEVTAFSILDTDLESIGSHSWRAIEQSSFKVTKERRERM